MQINGTKFLLPNILNQMHENFIKLHKTGKKYHFCC